MIHFFVQEILIKCEKLFDFLYFLISKIFQYFYFHLIIYLIHLLNLYSYLNPN